MTKDWISVKDLASIKGVTERAVRKAVNQNKYVTRMVDGTTGAKYEILVESLDYNLQNVINFEKTKNNFENKVEPSLQKITQYPTKAKQIALARYDLVNLWVDYIKNSPLKKTESGKEFLEIYNKGEIYSALYKILGHVAVGTIYRWQKEIKNNNNFENLIPKYDYGEKEHSAKLTQNELIVFKSLLLSPNKVNIGKATRLTKHILSKRGLDSPSSVQTFRRFANNYRNKHYDEWIFAREGQKALRDKVEPYIKRDISKLEVGDVLVADGHRLAVQCINPYTGKPCRPTLIGYLDWKSTALVGYEIMLEENTQAITSELFDQIVRELIRKPRIIIVDEIDYLTQEKSAIEMLRDIHDRTHTPIILIGMSLADKKLKRYKHLYDRLSEILHYQPFLKDDVKNLITELSEVKFDDNAIEYVYKSGNRFRQLVKIINKAETFAKSNDIDEIHIKDVQLLSQ